MRTALCRWIECMALCELPDEVSSSINDIHLFLTETFSLAEKEPLLSAVTSAYASFTNYAYLNKLSYDQCATTIYHHCHTLHSMNEVSRQGSACALSALSFMVLKMNSILQDSLKALIAVIVPLEKTQETLSIPSSCIAINDGTQFEVVNSTFSILLQPCHRIIAKKDTNQVMMTRKYCVVAMGILISVVLDQDSSLLSPLLFQQVYRAMLVALSDYTTGQQGDVGSLVREAAMQALCRIHSILDKHVCPLSMFFSRDLVTSAIGKMVRMSLDKLDRLRVVAVKSLEQLMIGTTNSSNTTSIETLAMDASLLRKALLSSTYEAIANCIQIPVYRRDCVAGLLSNMAGFSESTTRPARSVFLSNLIQCSEEGETSIFLEKVIDDMLSLARSESRLLMPVLKGFETIFSDGGLLDRFNLR